MWVAPVNPDTLNTSEDDATDAPFLVDLCVGTRCEEGEKDLRGAVGFVKRSHTITEYAFLTFSKPDAIRFSQVN